MDVCSVKGRLLIELGSPSWRTNKKRLAFCDKNVNFFKNFILFFKIVQHFYITWFMVRIETHQKAKIWI
jgi:hypothetical protein